jgi:hypothetical protein
MPCPEAQAFEPGISIHISSNGDWPAALLRKVVGTAKMPFAPSLSKGHPFRYVGAQEGRGFDKLSPNGCGVEPR